mgnify:FL=1
MRRALGAITLTALTGLATLALLQALGPDWARFLPANCLASHCFCEAPRTGQLLLQPANSWSSLGFVLVGGWILLGARGAEGAFSGWAAAWFAITAIVIGVGSVLLHATLTRWGQFYDVLGMYLLSGFMLAYAMRRWLDLPNGTAVGLYLALCAGLIGLLWLMPETRRFLFAIVLGGAIAVELVCARPRRAGVNLAWFWYGFLANALAFGIWMLDNSLTLCAPHSLLQGHAVWHLLGAAAVYCTYLYYRSERAVGVS